MATSDVDKRREDARGWDSDPTEGLERAARRATGGAPSVDDLPAEGDLSEEDRLFTVDGIKQEFRKVITSPDTEPRDRISALKSLGDWLGIRPDAVTESLRGVSNRDLEALVETLVIPKFIQVARAWGFAVEVRRSGDAGK